MRVLREIPFLLVAGLVFHISFYGIYPFLLPIAAIPLTLLAVIATALSYAELRLGHGKSKNSLRSKHWTCGVIGFSLLIIISVCITNWPLHLSFRASRGSLNALAQTLKQSDSVELPCNAGLFRIVKVDVKNGIVYLLMEEDAGEPLTFVQDTKNKSASYKGDVGVIVLDENWYFYNSL